jgi:hypothetical protein
MKEARKGPGFDLTRTLRTAQILGKIISASNGRFYNSNVRGIIKSMAAVFTSVPPAV